MTFEILAVKENKKQNKPFCLKDDLKPKEKSKCKVLDEIMDMAAANSAKRRKTRRGKKKPYHRDVPLDVESTLLEGLTGEFVPTPHHHAKSRNKKYLRPSSSPKAPMNSTQFLIEDSGNDLLHFDSCKCMSTSSDQAIDLSNDAEFDHIEHSLYEDSMFEKSFGNEDEYVPICLDETTDFIGKEFERELQLLQDEQDDIKTRLNERMKDFRDVSKDEIIEKYMNLENRLNSARSRKTHHYRHQTEMDALIQDNILLKNENQYLKSLVN